MRKAATPRRGSGKKAAPQTHGARRAGVKAKTVSALRAAEKAPGITGPRVRGHVKQGRLYIPTDLAKQAVVPPDKLRKGLEASSKQINAVLSGFTSLFAQDFEVSEIELSLSFNADGKFLGFGVGGEMAVTIKIVPSQAEDA